MLLCWEMKILNWGVFLNFYKSLLTDFSTFIKSFNGLVMGFFFNKWGINEFMNKELKKALII